MLYKGRNEFHKFIDSKSHINEMKDLQFLSKNFLSDIHGLEKLFMT